MTSTGPHGSYNDPGIWWIMVSGQIITTFSAGWSPKMVVICGDCEGIRPNMALISGLGIILICPDGVILAKISSFFLYTILLMVQKSGDHHLGCTKPLVNTGINYQSQLVQDFLLSSYSCI